MTKPDNVIARKMANALMKDAEMGDRASALLGAGGRLGTNAVKKLMGGLWVGGTTYLTTDAVEFHPNGLNRALHKDPDSMSVVLPLRMEAAGYPVALTGAIMAAYSVSRFT